MLSCYISGPLTGATPTIQQNNIDAAEEISLMLWREGLAPICPHTNTGRLAGFVDYDTFLRGDLRHVEIVDFVFMMADWVKSKGAVLEHAHAIKIRKPIVYSTYEDSNLTFLYRASYDLSTQNPYIEAFLMKGHILDGTGKELL